MGLEAPLALLGLLAAVLPVLIHRMRKRELPRLVLPTFALLARASAKSQQRRALSDLLLLVLRIAILVLLCLSLATPYVTARVSLGDGQLGSVVFVIDDSLSMSREEPSGALISQARLRVQDAVASLPVGSEVAIILGGKPARVLAPLSPDLGAAQRVLAEDLPALRRGDLDRAVQLGLSQLSAARWPRRSLFVLSDFARGAALDLSGLQTAGMRVQAERVGSPPSACNVYFEQLHAAADPSRPNQTSISLALKSACPPGAPPIDKVRVEVTAQGKTRAQSELSLGSGHAVATLSVETPDADADPGARVRVIADDALRADNELGVLLARSDAVRVLMVNGDPRPSSREDELYYALRALTLVPDAWLSLSLRSVDPLSMERAQLRDVDVVLLANVPAPEPALAQELQRFVESGGGLIVTAGHRIDAQRYNAVLGPVLATHIIGTGRAPNVAFADKIDTSYLPDGLAGLREVRTRERLLLERSAQTPLEFADGLPALAARNVGEGRSLLFASTIDPDWSDLPFRPGYLPLLAAMLRDAAGSAAVARTPLSPGDEVVLPWPRLGGGLEVQGPDGRTERFAYDPKQPSLRYRGTDAIGVFQVRAVSESGVSRRRAAFVVNPPSDEGDVTPGTLPKTDEARHGEAPVSVHRALDAPLLWLVLALAMVEGILRSRRKV
jgi:hypothetical protein